MYQKSYVFYIFNKMHNNVFGPFCTKKDNMTFIEFSRLTSSVSEKRNFLTKSVIWLKKCFILIDRLYYAMYIMSFFFS